MKKAHKVIGYDVWGNDEDGYEVNDVYTTNYIIDIEAYDTDETIVSKLINCGYCSKKAKGMIRVDPNIDCFDTIYMVEIATLKPFCEIRPIN